MPRGRNPGFRPGNQWVHCDRCGFAYRQSDMRKEWTGAVVCKWDYEPRHPQDFVRGLRDRLRPQGLVRSEPADEYRTVTYGTSGTLEATIPGGNHGTDIS